MSKYIGDFVAGASIKFKFNTSDTFAGSPVLRVYKDDSATESSAGISLTIDFDSRPDFHHVTIDTTSDDTFYSVGSDFSVIVTAGTVGGVSAIGEIIRTFSIQNRSDELSRIEAKIAARNTQT